MEAMIFMMIFGAALLLTAAWLAFAKDPRHSVLLYKVQGLSSMPREKARGKARQLAKIVGIIGTAIIVVFGIGTVVFMTGCSPAGQVMDGDGMVRTFEYTQISQDEAKQMMGKDDGHVIVDVRRDDEYAQGHIPGAILIPNESIEYEQPEELPDYDQVILVYCRTGRRSKEAAQKLADMGYSQVYEFGGIEDWDGEIER